MRLSAESQRGGAVAETVDAVVLLRDDVEVARVPVTLRADEVTTARW